MDFLPTILGLGTRPRLAVEIRAEGVVAARSQDAAALLTAVARASVGEGAVAPGLRAGNIVDRAGVVAAVRTVLDQVSGRESAEQRGVGGRSRHVTLIVPDAAVRVLLLEFDQLPSKLDEALPVVRFRLKKLLPFDADEAVISYQVMSTAKAGLRALVLAMPKAVLAEYESVVTAAGYLSGAVLPSTLAALAGLDEIAEHSLVVNASLGGVTTAIVQSGILLLHRSMDMGGDTGGEMSGVMAGVIRVETIQEIALVDRENTAQEWALQEGSEMGEIVTPVSMMEQVVVASVEPHAIGAAAAQEIVQAVSVAAAYFEDTLQVAPESVLSAGTLGASMLTSLMEESGMEGLRVHEIVDAGMMAAGAVTATVPRGWLAGVRGALKN
jgi:type IV pilus assembly protein PilM